MILSEIESLMNWNDIKLTAQVFFILETEEWHNPFMIAETPLKLRNRLHAEAILIKCRNFLVLIDKSGSVTICAAVHMNNFPNQ